MQFQIIPPSFQDRASATQPAEYAPPTTVTVTTTTPPVIADPSAGELLKLLASLESGIQRAAAFKGEIASNTLVARAQSSWKENNVAIVLSGIAIGAAVGAALLPGAGVVFGAIAGGVATGVGMSVGLSRLRKYASTDVLSVTAAEPLQIAYERGGALQKGLVSKLAKSWLDRLDKRGVDGVYVSRALRELANRPIDQSVQGRVEKLYKVHLATTSEEGIALKKLSDWQASNLRMLIPFLGFDTISVQNELRGRYFKGERARVEIGPTQRRHLLEALVPSEMRSEESTR